MKRIFFVLAILIGVNLFNSCKNADKANEDKKSRTENKILQQKDGTISLNVDKAECYSDMTNPYTNTAEWDVVVSKSGRFNVWLSSATIDTTNLRYKNPVMLSIRDHRLEAHPECDKVIQNSSEVNYPYFRADSFVGSLYIQDTGLFKIQVISEKIVPKDYRINKSSVTENSKLLSVFFTPITR